nr:hypothetical protein CFP56_09040 [Quercus suber]
MDGHQGDRGDEDLLDKESRHHARHSSAGNERQRASLQELQPRESQPRSEMSRGIRRQDRKAIGTLRHGDGLRPRPSQEGQVRPGMMRMRMRRRNSLQENPSRARRRAPCTVQDLYCIIHSQLDALERPCGAQIEPGRWIVDSNGRNGTRSPVRALEPWAPASHARAQSSASRSRSHVCAARRSSFDAIVDPVAVSYIDARMATAFLFSARVERETASAENPVACSSLIYSTPPGPRPRQSSASPPL